MRPRPTQGPTPADARAEDESNGRRADPRARLHPGPPPRPLRTRSRRHTAVPVGHRIRRTQTGHLISTGLSPSTSTDVPGSTGEVTQPVSAQARSLEASIRMLIQEGDPPV